MFHLEPAYVSINSWMVIVITISSFPSENILSGHHKATQYIVRHFSVSISPALFSNVLAGRLLNATKRFNKKTALAVTYMYILRPPHFSWTQFLKGRGASQAKTSTATLTQYCLLWFFLALQQLFILSVVLTAHCFTVNLQLWKTTCLDGGRMPIIVQRKCKAVYAPIHYTHKDTDNVALCFYRLKIEQRAFYWTHTNVGPGTIISTTMYTTSARSPPSHCTTVTTLHCCSFFIAFPHIFYFKLSQTQISLLLFQTSECK